MLDATNRRNPATGIILTMIVTMDSAGKPRRGFAAGQPQAIRTRDLAVANRALYH